MRPRARSGVVVGGSPVQSAAYGAATAPATSQPRARTGALSGGLAGAFSNLGPRGYLYLLVLLEVALIGALRHAFRDHHGG